MSTADGWRSKGTEMRCPKCGEMGTQIETTMYGDTRIAFFCNTCSHDWKGIREPQRPATV